VKRVVPFVTLKLGFRVLKSKGWNSILDMADDREIKIRAIRNYEIDLAFIEWLIINKPSEQFVIQKYIEESRRSQSEFRQDVVALAINDFKREGLFIDVGACDGQISSNSLLQESHFDWKGILVEPAKVWHNSLRSNRKSIIDTRCVWSHSGQRVDFIENESPGLSGIRNSDSEYAQNSYKVETVSLDDLLLENKITQPIDFLSVDTEGSELEVLSGLSFQTYRPKFISVEHNFDIEKRKMILEKMVSYGYERLFPELSYVDDWYVHKLWLTEIN
jgi:FkbM family methyltransferase